MLQQGGNDIDNILNTLNSNKNIQEFNLSFNLFKNLVRSGWIKVLSAKIHIFPFSIGGKYDSMQMRKILKRNRCIGKKLGKQMVLRYWWHFYALNPQPVSPLTPTLISMSFYVNCVSLKKSKFWMEPSMTEIVVQSVLNIFAQLYFQIYNFQINCLLQNNETNMMFV